MRRLVNTSVGGIVVSFNRDATKARAALLDRDGWEFRTHIVAAAELGSALMTLGVPADEADRIARETLTQLHAQT